MRVWTLNELFQLTRVELFELHREIVAALMAIPDSAPERPIALANLRNIRTVLADDDVAPR